MNHIDKVIQLMSVGAAVISLIVLMFFHLG